jgi:5-(carboxyamino)imidazole ribonucleotide synthase
MLDSKLRMPFVWKCTEFGYDGNGVKVIRAMEDLDHLPNVECITEEMISLKKASRNCLS